MMITRSQRLASHIQPTNRRLKASHKKGGSNSDMATQNDGEGNRATESMVTEDLENEQPLYNPATRKQWVTKLGMIANHEVVRFMKNHLPAEVMALFKETIFKQFMECCTLMVYPQLLHMLMKEELRQPNPDIVKI